MIAYQKDGKQYLLMSNSVHGVMKIPTADFGTAGAITAKVATPTAGIPYEKIASLTGVEQLDLLDGQRFVMISKTQAGARNLTAVVLP
jgi:hypothetical protein